jgi:NAD(P)H-flavin reductase
LIGGYLWQKVTGLSGAVGDYGGTTTAGTAYIVTGALGNGIQVTAVPEPSSVLLVASGLGLLAWRQVRRRR